MAHLSRPLMIAAGCTVALMALWLVALRPHVAVQNTPLAPTRAIPQAKQAAAISDAANAKLQAASGGSAQAAPAAAPGANPAVSAGGSPTAADPAVTAKRSIATRRDAGILRDVAAGKVVVVLFWNANSADDIATRGALRGIDRRGGKVVVRVVPIENVAQYASITLGVKIAQSPTTVIVGHKGRTRVIAGLTESHELAQAVGDALAGR
ncbi:MAG: hypothetical protein QOJ35_4063 [Solirubrobacteraceae bacterium]|jgi:hypothetical protein|nr:hypothetical protein [Solirubrobacteraceae bacterium]